MARLLQQRFKDTGLETFSRLFNEEHELICYIIEPAWKNNLRRVSCIPVGSYLLIPKLHKEKGKVFRYVDDHDEIKNREGVLMHVGNNRYDTHGCSLPGLELVFGDIVWKESQKELAPCPGVKYSGGAMDLLYHLYPMGFDLEVENAFDEVVDE